MRFLNSNTKEKIRLYNLANISDSRASHISYDDCSFWAYSGFEYVVHYDQQDKRVIDWLRKTINNNDYSWINGVAAFRNAEEATMFKLLWGK